jgi:anti-anti-sigma factor
MKSQIKRVGDTIVVSVEGKLDYETQDSFKENLKRIATAASTGDVTPTKVIFDMGDLEFVGSSGITQFIQTLKDFGVRTDKKAHIVKASSEFRKVMKAYDDEETFQFVDVEGHAPQTKRIPSA